MPDRARTEHDPEFYEAPTIRPGGPAPEDPGRTVEHHEGPRPSPHSSSPGASWKPATLAEFKRSLVEAGLIEAEEMARFAAEAPGGVPELARALVKGGKLTAYQASAANQGKTKGLVIGNYFVLDRLGAGGMGVVFKARHRRLGRVVALKILPPSLARDRDLVLRFRREVDAAARLKHPNVIAAVDADEDRGVHFLAMDFVDGKDLERLVAERGPLPVGQALDCVIQAARGLDAAHSAGIIHRDIKPGNLMLDGSGAVRVLDLGLARFVEASNPFGQASGPALTQSGSYMGTVDYMAPEQAEDSRRVDGRADIYSLGCTLYYLLTGKPPFAAGTVLKRLMAHQERPAPSLIAARPDVPGALEEVYLAMMAKRPGDRPPSMAEVVTRLEASRAPKEAMKAQTGLKDLAEEAVKRASPRDRRGRDASIFAHQEVPSGLHIDPDLSFEDLVMDLREEVHPTPKAFEDEEEPLHRLKPAHSRSGHRRKSRRGMSPLMALGALAVLGAVAAGFLASRRNAEDLGPIGKNPPPKPARSAVQSPLPADSEPASLVEEARFEGHGHDWVDGVAVAPDGKTLVTSCEDGKVRHWEIATGRLLRVLWHPKATKAVEFLPDGRRVVTGCVDGFVRIWDLSRGVVVGRFEGHKGPIHQGLALSRDGLRLATGSADRSVILRDVETGRPEKAFNDLPATIISLAFSPDGRRLLAGCDDGTIHLLDVASGTARPLTPAGEKAKVWTVAFAPDGRHAASGSDDGLLIYWDLDAAKAIHRHEVGNQHVRAVRFEPDGRLLRVATQTVNDGHSGQFLTWDIATGQTPAMAPSPSFSNLVLLPGGRMATGGGDGIARVWRVSPRLALARGQVKEGKAEEALAAYNAEVADRPDDARLRVERGRLLLARGRGKEADADFARAHDLSSGNLQLFVDAGVWTAGPFPVADPMAPVGPRPAAEADPSKPVPGPNGQPLRWVDTPTGNRGHVNLDGIYHAEGVEAYVLAVVYSPRVRPALMMLGTDDQAGVWLNDYPNPFLTTAGYKAPDSLLQLRELRPGRNTILARVVNPKGYYSLNLRFSEDPYDLATLMFDIQDHPAGAREYSRALDRNPSILDPNFFHRGGIALAEQARWNDAIGAYERAIALTPDERTLADRRRQLAFVHLGAGDLPAYRAASGEAIERFVRTNDPNPFDANNFAWLAAVVPDSPQLVDAERLARFAVDKTASSNATVLNTYGCLLYRRKNLAGAERYLGLSIRAKKGAGTAMDLVFLAMAQHRLNKPEARKSLDRARELAKSVQGWQAKAETALLLAEAEQVLKGPRKP